MSYWTTRREAAFYVALLGWKWRSDDGQQAILDIGAWESAVFRHVASGNFSVKVPEGREVVVTGFALVIGNWNANASLLCSRSVACVPWRPIKVHSKASM
ncbi:MAG TPA: hypothetical protein VGL55_00625 [Steroidobacteraceae bacterium]